MIEEYAEGFRDKAVLVRVYEGKLRLRTNELLFQKPCAIPMAYQQVVAEKIKRIVEMDIIDRSR